MAKPETGTTAAHAAALYTLDEEKADEYFDKLIDNVVWLTGNAHCMRDVASGRFAFGWTDTDDFNVALIQGRPVAMVYPDRKPDQVGVMYIPNSLVLIKGAKNPGNGKRLIDWLLRPEIEAELAKSATAQIPVRSGVPAPPHVRSPKDVGKIMPLDWVAIGKGYDKWVQRVRGKHAEKAEEATPTLFWILAAVAAVAVAAVLVLKRATGEPV